MLHVIGLPRSLVHAQGHQVTPGGSIPLPRYPFIMCAVLLECGILKRYALTPND